MAQRWIWRDTGQEPKVNENQQIAVPKSSGNPKKDNQQIAVLKSSGNPKKDKHKEKHI